MKKELAIAVLISLIEGAGASTQSSLNSSPESISLFLAIISPFVASVLIGLFYSYFKDFSAYLGASAGVFSFINVLNLMGSQGVVGFSWIPSLGIGLELYVDGLSLLFAALASGIGALIFLYSRAYMDHDERKRKYYTVLTAFMGSMIGLVFSSNMILLFMFWEFTSICSFLLISHNQTERSSLLASKKSLIVTVGSGVLLLVGFLILESVTGTFSIAELLADDVTKTLVSSGAYLPALALIGVGAAAKSAQVPLHFWLPDAMGAPTPVSAFLHSATMVKAGVFIIGRFRPILMDGEAWSIAFISLGLLTMTVAALLAVAAEELKELLAYSTASHLGLIVAGFGFSSILGAETGSFHILNHAVFKASLFMVAGVVLNEAGTQKFEELSGLGKRWPLLAAIATVSGLGMAGLPPLNGFYSKELLFEASYHAATHSELLGVFIPVVAVLGSIFTFAYSLKFISVFYGDLSIELPSVSRLLMLPPALLGFGVLMIGLAPNSFIDLLVEPALSSVSGSHHGMSVSLFALKPSVFMSAVTILLGALTFRRQDSVEKNIRRVLEIRLLTANYYYELSLDSMQRLSDFTVNNIETGLVRTYAIWTLSVTALLGITGFIILGVPSNALSNSITVFIVLATSVASAYAILRSDTYISSVLTLSILGFMVSIFYLLMDAPDLVMTQLVVESLSLIIFLMVLNRLPEYSRHVEFSRKFRDILIAGAGGLLVFLSTLYSTSVETPGKTAEYFIENALPGSGGTNVVNVILVDFRGLDTMGEISVIVMAGLAVLMLFRMRGEEG
jgi:multicomponent Na+:H+ antiporter subunit A